MNQARAKVPLILLLFLVIELTVLDRLRVFGAGPDVMLLLAVVAGIVGGPRVGALFGFASGFVLDLFLETPMGLSALVYGISGSGKVTTLYPSNFKPKEIVHDVPLLASS